MENMKEPLKQNIDNGDSIEEVAEYDLDEMYVKFKSNQVRTHSDTVNSKSLKNEFTEFEIDTIKILSDVSSEKMESINNIILKEEKKYNDGDKINENPIEACTECEYKSSHVGNITKHIQEVHKKPHTCNICFKMLSSSSHLKRHIRSHTGERPFKCPECEYRSNNAGNITKHIKFVHKKERPHICEVCSKAYTKMLDLSYHMKSIHGVGNAQKQKKSYAKNYECNQCEYKCSWEYTMKNHIQHVHTNERPFQCECCPKTYKDQRGLNYHMEASHGSENTKQVTCEECGKSLKSKDTFRAHKRVYHPVSGDEENYYSCDQCEYKNRYMQNTKVHIKMTHINKRLQCEYCPNTYKTMDSLRYHKGSAHEIGSDTSTCDNCGKTCPTKMHLRDHKKKCTNLITQP